MKNFNGSATAQEIEHQVTKVLEGFGIRPEEVKYMSDCGMNCCYEIYSTLQLIIHFYKTGTNMTGALSSIGGKLPMCSSCSAHHWYGYDSILLIFANSNFKINQTSQSSASQSSAAQTSAAVGNFIFPSK